MIMSARILCVDDDSHINELNQVVLTRAGYDVEVSESPSDALNRLTVERFDLVITDLFPQSASDAAFMTNLRRLNPSMPVILVTGNHNPPPEILRQADAFVVKAYSLNALTDSVREVLLRSKLRRIG
jgi:two-component system, NtrC family, C4-dicarboxylate transport response regulator DctD